MNVNTFIHQVRDQDSRLERLYEKASATPVPPAETLLPFAFKELGNASEELHIALEELISQRDELMAAQQAVEIERQRYQDLFEFAPDAYLVTDSAGTIQQANRAAATLLNLSLEYLVGKPLAIFVAEQDRLGFRSQLNQGFEQDINQEWVARICPRKGEPFDAALTCAIIRNSKDKLVSLRICIRDITHRLQAKKVLLCSDDYNFSQDRPKQFYPRGNNIPLNQERIWLVCQGIVKLSTICENGCEVIVGLAGPQMPFGASLTSLKIYQATALSKNVQLVSISLSELAASPTMAAALLPKINRRLQQTESFLTISGQMRVSDRLRHLLLILQQEIGSPVQGGNRLSVRLTHNDLASFCCTTRVTITRMLGKLQQQGKIAFDRRNHMILKDGCFEDMDESIAMAV